MKITALLENTACRDDLAAAHGLSLYIETPRHKILVDAGPNNSFLENAKTLGIDLEAVDVAILSHGHYDHAGGLGAFLEKNQTAAVYLQEQAFGDYVLREEDGSVRYIGVDQTLRDHSQRIVFTKGDLRIDEELALFSGVTDAVGALAASHMLYVRTEHGLLPDRFFHEQNLLITDGGKTLLVAGCAHCGIVNILQETEQRLNRRPDVTFGGFHLFQLKEGDPGADELIEKTGKALLEGDTVYYTGHCTGDYAYKKLKEILGERLQRMSGGITVEF